MKLAPRRRTQTGASGIYAAVTGVRLVLFAVKKLFLRKRPRFLELRFTRRGGICQLNAMFMNQLTMIWGCWKELSSTAACPRDIRLGQEERPGMNYGPSSFRLRMGLVVHAAHATAKHIRSSAILGGGYFDGSGKSD
jgi:hypothetical protein